MAAFNSTDPSDLFSSVFGFSLSLLVVDVIFCVNKNPWHYLYANQLFPRRYRCMEEAQGHS